MVLPIAYLGPRSWFEAWMRGGIEGVETNERTTMEVMESFEKQTFRNRCSITDLQGRIIGLTVPVQKVEHKQFTRDIRISYQQKWQHQHWQALQSAYKHTPYFDYYADYLRPFYECKVEWLIDLNMGLAEVIASLLRNEVPQVEIGKREWKMTTDWSGEMWTDQCAWQREVSVVDELFRWGPEGRIERSLEV